MWQIGAAMIIALACGGAGTQATGPAAGTEVGTYRLVTVDGKTLPAAMQEGGMQFQVDSSTLTLGIGGTIAMSTFFRAGPQLQAASTSVGGTYALRSDTLSFSYTNGGRNIGVLDGTTLRFINEAVIWVFRKQ